jgi:hypothetical protein
MEPEKRRRFVRKRTDQLLYAELGPDNGSILLNLCEEGCSFQSIAPVRDEQVHFSVSVGDGRKLEGEGQIVWSDAAKKTGGLLFLNPSQELREQVREWLDATLVTADGKLDPAAVESNAKRRRKELREEARAAVARARKGGALKAVKAESTAGIEGQTSEMSVPDVKTGTVGVISGIGATDKITTRVGQGNSAGVWWGVGAIALAAILFLTLVAYHRELGHLLMSIGSSIAGDEQKSNAAAPPEVRPVPADSVSDVKPAALSDGQNAQDLREGAVFSGAEAAPANVEPTGYTKRNSAPQTGLSEDVPSLWNSVENGDTRAEVALANRYVRGDGVPRSCAQARVLLEAAIKRGSAEGKQKLDELAHAGCP